MYLLFTDSAFRVNDASHAAPNDEVSFATAMNASAAACMCLREHEVSSKTEIHYLDGEYRGACAERLHVEREYVSRTRCVALVFCLPQVSRRYSGR